MLKSMKDPESDSKKKKRTKATHIAGVEQRHPFTVVGRPGVFDAETLEEVIQQLKDEEVEDGNK